MGAGLMCPDAVATEQEPARIHIRERMNTGIGRPLRWQCARPVYELSAGICSRTSFSDKTQYISTPIHLQPHKNKLKPESECVRMIMHKIKNRWITSPCRRNHRELFARALADAVAFDGWEVAFWAAFLRLAHGPSSVHTPAAPETRMSASNMRYM